MDYTKQTIAIFDKHAHRYQERFMDVSLYHDALNVFLKNLPEGKDLLDIACGPGNVCHYLLTKNPELRILGTDLSPKMLELATANNPTAEFQLLDSRDIKKLNRKFDGVICSFGLPYLSKSDTLQLIADAAFILNPGGVLYISTMEDDNSKSGLELNSAGEENFTNYHEAGYLIKAMEEQQMQVVHEERKHYEYNGKKTVDLILVAVRSPK